MRTEFRLLHKIFATYLPPVYPYAVYGGDRFVKITDFDDRVDVIPVADPNVFSLAQRVTLANETLKIAMSAPEIHDIREAYRRVYNALGTQNIEDLLKPEEPKFPKDPAIENMEALQMKMPKAFPTQEHDAHITAHSLFIKTRMVQINPPVYALFQGHMSEHISLKATMEVYVAMKQDPKYIEMEQANPDSFRIEADALVAKRVNELTMTLIQEESATSQQDPLVALKQRELDLKAMDIQRRSKYDDEKLDQQQTQFEDRLDLDEEKLQQQRELQAQRLSVSMQSTAMKVNKPRGSGDR
jgi:hypothetical protein